MTLTEKWADGASTLHGMHSRGFPNCFIFSITQSGFTVNFPHMLNEQSKHLAYILQPRARATTSRVDRGRRRRPRTTGSQTIVDLAQMQPSTSSSRCTPGYYNNEGKPGERSVRNGFYGAGSIAFFKVLEDWRADGDLAGLELGRR